MSKNVKTALGIGLTVLILALLVIFSLLSGRVKPNPEGTVGNTAGNLNNQGLFCEYNGTVYFSNSYDGGSLYSMKPDETGIKKLHSSPADHILAGGSYLYYIQQAASGAGGMGYIRTPYGLYRTSLKGGRSTCLTQDLIYSIQLAGNHLYYTTTEDDGARFYKLKIDKTERTLLLKEAVNPACAVGTQFYYNGTGNNHYLNVWDTSTDVSSLVWEGNLWYPVYDNGYIYYLDVPNNYRLCRYLLSGGSVEVLTHDRVDCFNVGGGYIYYQCNSGTAPALKKMNSDGSQPEIVAEGNYTAINMTSRYVYFHLFDSEVPMYRVPLGSTAVSSFEAAAQAAMENIK